MYYVEFVLFDRIVPTCLCPCWADIPHVSPGQQALLVKPCHGKTLRTALASRDIGLVGHVNRANNRWHHLVAASRAPPVTSLLSFVVVTQLSPSMVP